ncbi:MAG TPA: hypothetical protein PKA00_18395 [Saprospiraceae bacterium]|nr:hypothetical protein [Saprospiraceae bacterium]HMQ84889.1 hypothetical protein [Saprospiraceae bacterium]
MQKLFHFMLCGCLVFFGVFFSLRGQAQPSSGQFGIGIQFGDPSGLSMRIHKPSGMSADILLAWDLDDFFFANVHGVFEQPISGSGNFNFIYGPGAFIGLRDRGNGNLFDGTDEVNLGVSGVAGLNVYIEQFEIYVRLTPLLLLVDRTDAEIGGGLGFRFYF